MSSSFTGEEVGKDKVFTHKSQHVKRIEGRGEGKKRKLLDARAKASAHHGFSGGEHKMQEFVQCPIVGERIKF